MIITMDDDFDRLLDDLEKSYGDFSSYKKREEKDEDSDNLDESPVEKAKCFPPYLGSNSTMKHPRSCSALRCIICDFNVIEISSSRWLPTADYYFLRTNMPNLQKLSQRLEPSQGSTAYACQCKCYTAQTLEPLHSIPQLQWICGGHRSVKSPQTKIYS